MIELPYSLIIETTEEPDYFGFYSPELEGFSGIGRSIEDCVYKAKWGMAEHVSLLREQGLPAPPANKNPTMSPSGLLCVDCLLMSEMVYTFLTG